MNSFSLCKKNDCCVADGISVSAGWSSGNIQMAMMKTVINEAFRSLGFLAHPPKMRNKKMMLPGITQRLSEK